MAWAPTKNVADLTKIVDNLIDYIEEYNADALLWANNGTALPEFARLYPNAAGRLETVFPSLMILSQEDEGEEAETENGDVLVTGLKLTIEVTLTGGDADVLTLTAPKYDLALKSMLVNIPAAVLIADTRAASHAWVKTIGTKFDVLRGYKTANNYMQIFQTSVLFGLITPAY